jgi:hypothetical protein
MSKAKAAAAQAAPEVFAQGYLLSAKGPELLKRLGAAFGVLKALEQQDNEKLPAGLENVASALLAEPIVASKSKVRARLAAGGSARGGHVTSTAAPPPDSSPSPPARAPPCPPPQDVRLLACCCIVEVLRIYAPTPPYQDVQLTVRRAGESSGCCLRPHARNRSRPPRNAARPPPPARTPPPAARAGGGDRVPAEPGHARRRGGGL